MACDVIRNDCFHCICEIPRQSRPPTILRGEQCPVDGDSKTLVPGYVVDPPQSILPAMLDGSGVDRGHVEFDPMTAEFDAHPMKGAVPLFVSVQKFATVRDTRKDLPRLRRAPLPRGRIRTREGHQYDSQA